MAHNWKSINKMACFKSFLTTFLPKSSLFFFFLIIPPTSGCVTLPRFTFCFSSFWGVQVLSWSQEHLHWISWSLSHLMFTIMKSTVTYYFLTECLESACVALWRHKRFDFLWKSYWWFHKWEMQRWLLKVIFNHIFYKANGESQLQGEEIGGHGRRAAPGGSKSRTLGKS